jgi:hypothetical protein
MREGLRVQIASASLPGLTPQSIFLREMMDARVKPAHDGESGAQ